MFYLPPIVNHSPPPFAPLESLFYMGIFPIFPYVPAASVGVEEDLQEWQGKINKFPCVHDAINMNGGMRRAVRGAEMIQHTGSRGKAQWEVGTNNLILQGIQALRDAFKES